MSFEPTEIIIGPNSSMLTGMDMIDNEFRPGFTIGVSFHSDMKFLGGDYDPQFLLSYKTMYYGRIEKASIDNDGDGLFDEDVFDLLDNDGDGWIDEDRAEKGECKGHHEAWYFELPLLVRLNGTQKLLDRLTVCVGPKVDFRICGTAYYESGVGFLGEESQTLSKRMDMALGLSAIAECEYDMGSYFLLIQISHSVFKNEYVSGTEVVWKHNNSYSSDQIRVDDNNGYLFSIALLVGFKI